VNNHYCIISSSVLCFCMAPKPKFTEEERERLVAAYASGRTLQSVADEFECSIQLVSDYAKKAGVPSRVRCVGRRYTAQERQKALNAYRAGDTLEEAAAVVGATLATVGFWAKKAGCLRTVSEAHRAAKRKGRGAHGEVVWNEIIDLYETGKTAAQVDEQLGLSKGVAYSILRRHGKVRPEKEWRAQAGITSRQTGRKYRVDEQVFERPMTPEKAWLLGVIYGDGCVVVDGGVRRSLEVAGDKDVCEKARIILGADAPVRKHGKRSWALRVSSTNLAESMEAWGVVPRKSNILSWPEELSHEFDHHFMRGLWDADGWVYLKRRRIGIGMTATDLMQNGIWQRVSFCVGRMVAVSCQVFDNPNHADCHSISVQGPSAVALGSWMWDDSQEHMRSNRKYNLWLQLRDSATG